jgi:hypothetical protein
MSSTNISANISVNAQAPDTFTKLELVSVRALIGYVAHNRNVNELFVRKMLLDNFKAGGLEELFHDQYDAVIRFLIDLPTKNG